MLDSMKSALIRAARTYCQVFCGIILANWQNVVDVHTGLSVVETASLAAIPAAVSLMQNMLEDKMPAVGARIPKG